MVTFDEYTLLSVMPELEITYEKKFVKYEYPKRVEIKVYEYIELDQLQ